MPQKSDVAVPSFSPFNLYSWIPRLAGQEITNRYYNFIMYQYMMLSALLSLPLFFVLDSHHYRATGAAVSLVHLALLVAGYVSFRKLVIIDELVKSRGRVARIWLRAFALCTHVMLLNFLILEVNNPSVQTILVLSFVGSLWVVMRVVVRSQRRCFSSAGYGMNAGVV